MAGLDPATQRGGSTLQYSLGAHTHTYWVAGSSPAMVIERDVTSSNAS